MSCQTTIPSDVEQQYVQLPEQIDYNFHVRPILSEHCFSCHGPDEANREADLRLDDPEVVFDAIEASGKYALVAGAPQKSEVYHRILSEEHDFVMPPPEAKIPLTNRQKAILIKWIEQGAPYQAHWAFVKPEATAPPSVNKKEWPINEIDFFVLKKLEEEGVAPSQEADKAALIRRLSFDLRGLPPSLEEIDAFLEDDSPDAYEKLVNQMLESPAYGERMAAYWLELARYADSDGYLDDKHRNFSPWRDWVIDAFNKNMSYKDFVSWQLAGDLMPNASREQILATAFNRLHKKNSEAGIVLEEYRTEYVADRANTFGKAFLGLTMECARCHTHKYDPISQEDYYSLFAFFNSTAEIGHAVYGPDITPGPALLLTDKAVEEQLNFINKAIEEQEVALKNFGQRKFIKIPTYSSLTTGTIADQLEKNLVAYYPFDTVFQKGKASISPNGVAKNKPAILAEPLLNKGKLGNALFNTDYSSTYLGEKIGWFERDDEFTVDFWVYPDTLYKEASVFLHCEDWRLGYKGYSLHLEENKLKFIMAHAYPQNAIQVKTEEAIPIQQWTHISLSYDGSSQAEGVTIYINGIPAKLQIDFNHLYKGILYVPDIHTYGFRGFQFGKRDGVLPMAKGGVDELRIYDRAITDLEVLFLHDKNKLNQILKDPQGEGSAFLENYRRNTNLEFRRKKRALQQKRAERTLLMNTISEIMVMGDLPSPRPTFILERGVYDAPGKEVFPNAPEQILPFPKEAPRNRLGLTEWLFHPDHPLTARVFVNQIWQMHFGKGLVKTTEDFGNQGALPSHPDLLDWLAVQFIASDWDIKNLHKQIVCSATYKQSAKIRADLLEKDPTNQWLARASRFRLPAEMIRDNALAMSGLLVSKIGGPSVYPYQPEGLWDEISNKKWRYPYLEEPGEGLYRRSLYTIWKRTSPPPSMLIFDANDRTICRVKRKNTNTPLQALVLLNDPQYLEAANVLADKIEQREKKVEQQLELAFRYVTGRLPDNKEKQVLLELYEQEKATFSAHTEDAVAYLAIGKGKKLLSKSPASTAALAVVINAIMNTDEGQSKS